MIQVNKKFVIASYNQLIKPSQDDEKSNMKAISQTAIYLLINNSYIIHIIYTRMKNEMVWKQKYIVASLNLKQY
jgi:hypothetical protein